MKILVVDSAHVSCSTLASDLKKELGHEAIPAITPAEALRWLSIELDVIGVVVVTLELGPDAGLSFIRKVREFCNSAAIRVPKFLVLTPGPLPDHYEERFQIMDAVCLLYGYWPQTLVTVHRLISKTLSEKGRPTISVDRSGPDSKFLVLGSSRPELISCGPRLLPMMNNFVINFGTELSTSTLAEVSDITLSSVRVYLNRLRARYDEARIKVGIDMPGREVFCTRRKDGAFVHVLKARVIFV
jgi:hypothetical protein